MMAWKKAKSLRVKLTHYARGCKWPARNGIDDAVLIKRNLCMIQNNARTKFRNYEASR